MISSKYGIVACFLISLIFCLIVPSYFTKISISFLIPSLIMAMYRSSQYGSSQQEMSQTAFLWLVFFSGIILDAIELTPRFGLYATSYLFTSYALYPLRHYFFKDAFSTLPIMTFLFSLLSNQIRSIILLIFDNPSYPFSLSWVITECVTFPFIDAVYAVLFFSLPYLFYSYFARTKKTRPSRHA